MKGYEVVKKEMTPAEAWRTTKIALNELGRALLNTAIPMIQRAVEISGQRITKLQFCCDENVMIELEVLNPFSNSPMYEVRLYHPEHRYLYIPIDPNFHIHWPKRLLDIAIDRLSLITDSEIEYAIDEELSK